MFHISENQKLLWVLKKMCPWKVVEFSGQPWGYWMLVEDLGTRASQIPASLWESLDFYMMYSRGCVESNELIFWSGRKATPFTNTCSTCWRRVIQALDALVLGLEWLANSPKNSVILFFLRVSLGASRIRHAAFKESRVCFLISFSPRTSLLA